MKILKRILYFILGLVALLCAFVMMCAFTPGLSRRVADVLYPNRGSGRTALSGEADGGGMQPGMSADSGRTQPGMSAGSGDIQSGLAAGLFGGGAGEGQSGLPVGNAGYDMPQNRSGMVAADQDSGYTPPERSELTIPESVSGRNGYEPVREQEEELDEDAADQIRNSLGTGETGDGFQFDPLYYPYYAMLDEKGQHLYRQIYANAGSYNRAFAPVEEVTAGQLSDVFSAVYNDHPELFWLNTAYSCKYVSGGPCVEINLEFNRTAQEPEGSIVRFAEDAERILSVAETYGSDYEKEKYVHDALIEKASYDLGANMNQSAYSALVNGRTVCAGYARAYQYLMQRLGIPCYYCTGYAGESHAWNIVMLGNEYYNVDVTWDDTDGGNYDYFNRTDRDFADTHIRQELSVYLPPCNGQTYRGLEPDREQSRAQEQPDVEPSGEPEQNRVQDQPDAEPNGEPEQSRAQDQPDVESNGEPEQNRAQDQSDVGQNAGEGLKSLEETGWTEEDILHNISEYYDSCFNRIVAAGVGSYEFESVIEGETFMRELYTAYDRNAYRQGYMEQAIDVIGASSWRIVVKIETLTEDRYLITHKISIR